MWDTSEISKAYRIYFPGFKKIDINRDIKFDEDSAYKKSRKRPVEDPEEEEVPRIQDINMNEATCHLPIPHYHMELKISSRTFTVHRNIGHDRKPLLNISNTVTLPLIFH